MKLRKLLCFSLLSFLVLSCGVLPQKNNFNETQKTLDLGIIGLKKISIHKTDFEEFGIPNYEELVKVSIVEKDFSKKIYNQYLKSTKRKQVLNAINYVDSLEIKPRYVEVSINDKVAVVNAVNKNRSLFNYIKNTPEAKIITSLRFVGSKSLQTKISQADAFYVVTDNQKKQRLYLYKNQQKIGEIDMSKNDVFAYSTGSFCWEVTDRKKIKIATLIETGESCRGNTKKKAEDLEKELTKSTFKF